MITNIELRKFVDGINAEWHSCNRAFVPPHILERHPNCFVVRPDFTFLGAEYAKYETTVAVDPDIPLEGWDAPIVAAYRTNIGSVCIELLKEGDMDLLDLPGFIDEVLWCAPAVWFGVGEARF